jgi:hypothetical protein
LWPRGRAVEWRPEVALMAGGGRYDGCGLQRRYCGSLTITARTPCPNAMPATIAATSASTWRVSASSAAGGSAAPRWARLTATGRHDDREHADQARGAHPQTISLPPRSHRAPVGLAPTPCTAASRHPKPPRDVRRFLPRGHHCPDVGRLPGHHWRLRANDPFLLPLQHHLAFPGCHASEDRQH